MNRWPYVIAILVFATGLPSVRADEARKCPQGRAIFGKLSCAGVAGAESVLDAYFFGATSLNEMRATFPDRVAKIEALCRKKVDERAARRSPAGAVAERGPVQYRVQSVEVCLGKRGYQKPCVRDDDCLEQYCHPERGTCSKVFTPPLLPQ